MGINLLMNNVLIIDDSQLMRDQIRELLAEMQLNIVGEAENGQEGVEMYFKLKPDLVIMDIHMPVLSGRDALNHIMFEDPDAQVIMCSTQGQDKRIAECISEGAQAFIIKPYVRDKAKQAISEVLHALT